MNNHQNQINEEEEEDRTHYQTMDDGEDVPSDSGYAVVAANPALPLRGEGSDQLTLSFQGEVYVFDSVSAEKVQAVLLLLGGYEIPSGVPTMQGSSQIERNSGDPTIRRTYLPQRAASLNRFREKRKERCFDKKIRYSVRKEVALRMQRKKGQFTSSKVNPEESGSSGLNGVDDSQQVTICTHCGTSSKSTPMMRRGPSGPRTLCNACGLMWANKGTLRALPKPMENQNLPLIPTEQGDVNDNSEIRANTEAFAVVTTSNENRDDNNEQN